MTTGKRQRRKYPEDFKREVVALVTEQGYTTAEARRSLYIGRQPTESLEAGALDTGQRQVAEFV